MGALARRALRNVATFWCVVAKEEEEEEEEGQEVEGAF